ncbi:Tyrosine kinase-like (TKL) protein, partial [Toxoplasma gondii MAS]
MCGMEDCGFSQVALAETQGCTYRLPKLLWRALAEAKEYERLFQSFSLEEANKLYGRRDVFADWQIENQRLRRAFLAQLQHQNALLQRARAAPGSPRVVQLQGTLGPQPGEERAGSPGAHKEPSPCQDSDAKPRSGQERGRDKARRVVETACAKKRDRDREQDSEEAREGDGEERGEKGAKREKQDEEDALLDQLEAYREREIRLRRRQAHLRRGIERALHSLRSASSSSSALSPSSASASPSACIRRGGFAEVRGGGAVKKRKREGTEMLLQTLLASLDDSQSQGRDAESDVSSSSSPFSGGVSPSSRASFATQHQKEKSQGKRPRGTVPYLASAALRHSPRGEETAREQGKGDEDEEDGGDEEGEDGRGGDEDIHGRGAREEERGRERSEESNGRSDVGRPANGLRASSPSSLSPFSFPSSVALRRRKGQRDAEEAGSSEEQVSPAFALRGKRQREQSASGVCRRGALRRGSKETLEAPSEAARSASPRSRDAGGGAGEEGLCAARGGDNNRDGPRKARRHVREAPAVQDETAREAAAGVGGPRSRAETNDEHGRAKSGDGGVLTKGTHEREETEEEAEAEGEGRFVGSDSRDAPERAPDRLGKKEASDEEDDPHMMLMLMTDEDNRHSHSSSSCPLGASENGSRSTWGKTLLPAPSLPSSFASSFASSSALALSARPLAVARSQPSSERAPEVKTDDGGSASGEVEGDKRGAGAESGEETHLLGRDVARPQSKRKGRDKEREAVTETKPLGPRPANGDAPELHASPDFTASGEQGKREVLQVKHEEYNEPDRRRGCELSDKEGGQRREGEKAEKPDPLSRDLPPLRDREASALGDVSDTRGEGSESGDKCRERKEESDESLTNGGGPSRTTDASNNQLARSESPVSSSGSASAAQEGQEGPRAPEETRGEEYLEDAVQVEHFGKYAALLKKWESVMGEPVPAQLLWLDETRPDRPVRPPSQDSYRDGSLFIECLHVESNFFRLLHRCFASCSGGGAAKGRGSLPDRLRVFRSQILEENAELHNMKKQLDASRYRLMKQTKLFLAQANSQFSNFHQLKRGYRLLNLLGKGGFAEVWEVFDPLTCDVLAAKLHVLSSVEKESARWHIVKRVQNEIEIHKDILPHPHIVEMKACFEMGNDVLASILEFCEGGDVDHFLKLSGPLRESLAAEWTRQILEALLYLKRQPVGVIHHLDIKPGNVLLQRGKCKLADFGLSRVIPREQVTHLAEGANGQALLWEGGGTLWYQPPECLIFQRQRQVKRACTSEDGRNLSPRKRALSRNQAPPGEPRAAPSTSPREPREASRRHEAKLRRGGEEDREEKQNLLALADKDLEAFFRALPVIRSVPLNDKIDIWAVGCILYEMLFNKRPFGPSPAQNTTDPT